MKRALKPDWASVALWASVLFGGWIVADTLMWIVRSYVALPFWDQWETISDYGKLRDGAYTFANLFSQQNEHRLVFPRLVFFADIMAFKGSDRLNLLVIAAFQLLHATLLVRLIGDLRRPLAAAGAALVFALMLSLGQWENLVWGFQVQFVDVFAVATAAFILLAKATSAATPGARTGLLCASAACLCISVFSMANGLAAVAVAIVLALALRAPRWMVVTLGLLLIALAAAYFHDYRPVAQHSTAAYALAHPFEYIAYVLAYLGNPAGALLLRPPTALLATLTGKAPVALGLLGVVGALCGLTRIIRRGGRDHIDLVLAAIVAFIGVTAAMTAVGRLEFGIRQAYSPRYVTPAAVFWAAQTVFWVRAALAGPQWGRWAAGGAVAAMAVLLLWVQLHIPREVMRHAASLHAAEDALLSNLPDDRLRAAFPDPQDALRRSDTLKRYGLSSYDQPESHWLGLPLTAIAPLAKTGACLGSFDRASIPAESPRFTGEVDGWGWDVAARRPAKRVVLTNERMQVVGLGSGGLERPDVQKALHRWGAGYAGWSGAARADGGILHAYLILRDGSACGVGSHRLTQSPSRLLQILPDQAGPSLGAPVVMRGGWTPGGVGAEIPTQTAQPRPSETIYGSWSGDDAKQGVISFGPFTTTGAGVAMGLITGPNTGGQSVVLKDAQTGAVYADLHPAARPEWVWRRVRIPPEAAGRPLLLQGLDQGGGGGQWLGMTAPHAIAF